MDFFYSNNIYSICVCLARNKQKIMNYYAKWDGFLSNHFWLEESLQPRTYIRRSTPALRHQFLSFWNCCVWNWWYLDIIRMATIQVEFCGDLPYRLIVRPFLMLCSNACVLNDRIAQFLPIDAAGIMSKLMLFWNNHQLHASRVLALDQVKLAFLRPQTSIFQPDILHLKQKNTFMSFQRQDSNQKQWTNQPVPYACNWRITHFPDRRFSSTSEMICNPNFCAIACVRQRR